MGKVWTTIKIVLGVFGLLFLMSVIYLLLTAPSLQGAGEGIYKLAMSVSPGLANMLKMIYEITVKITGYAYKIFKVIIDTLYNIVVKH